MTQSVLWGMSALLVVTGSSGCGGGAPSTQPPDEPTDGPEIELEAAAPQEATQPAEPARQLEIAGHRIDWLGEAGGYVFGRPRTSADGSNNSRANSVLAIRIADGASFVIELNRDDPWAAVERCERQRTIGLSIRGLAPQPEEYERVRPECIRDNPPRDRVRFDAEGLHVEQPDGSFDRIPQAELLDALP